MASKPTRREKLQYWFDNLFSRGPLIVIAWLALATGLLVAVMTAVSVIPGIQPDGLDFKQLFWTIFYQSLTPNPYDPSARWPFLVVMLVMTLGNLFLVSLLIGTLSNSISAKVDDMRKGRSRVLENNHTLILGWSNQVFTILSELMVAFENQKSGRIVILADNDKIEMEDEIRSRVKVSRNTQIICRTGNPIDLADLEIANPHAARSIIILPPETNDPDAFVIKTILALTNNPNRRREAYHIVTQIREPKNMDVVRMISERDQVKAVLIGDMVSRVIAQTSRQSGLSLVYTELLNFQGDEIYFQEEPALVGKTFGEALLAYEKSAVVGLRFADGHVNLLPAMDSRISPGDKIIAISEDDDTVKLSGLTQMPVDESAICSASQPEIDSPARSLILGWNQIGSTIIQELDAYVPNGSRLMVIADPDVSRQVSRVEDAVAACGLKTQNQRVSYQKGDTTSRDMLDQLKVMDFNHIIVLSYAGLGVQEADARTLVTLLHLRHISDQDNLPISIVSEMLDLRNRELAEVAHVDDFIVSDHLISLMLAQLSENEELFDVFTDIFDPIGAEIYLKPMSAYVETDRPVTFYTVVEAARRRGESAIGYRLVRFSEDREQLYGIHTNPPKSALVTFSPDDKIIVVAEQRIII